MDIDELKAALEAKDAELAETKSALARAEADKNSTVEEVKSLRQKKQEVEAERDLALAKVNNNEPKGTEDVAAVVQKELDAREAKDIEATKARALETFKNSHKALFDESNDPGGLKWQAYQNSLAKLNLSNLKTAEQFSGAYEDALILLNKGRVQNQPNQNGYGASIPTNPSSAPKSTDGTELSYKEQKLIESLGWTEERYLKQKKARPGYVMSLLNQFTV